MIDEQLAALDERIERLVTDPDAVRAPWVRLARPLLARLGYQAEVKIAATQKLLSDLRALGDAVPSQETVETLQKCMQAAVVELDHDVKSVERVCVLQRKPQVAHASWLRQLAKAIRTAYDALSHIDQPSLRRIAGAIEPVTLLPPLTIRRLEDGKSAEPSDPTRAEGETNDDAGDPATRRMLELQLGSVDHLLAAARDESDVLARRRRLLEAARQILIESAAALPVDATGLEARRRYIAREIARLDRVQAAGVAPEVALLHQARTAVSRGESDKLVAILTLLDGTALARGDRERAKRTGDALKTLWGSESSTSRESLQRSRSISAREVFGADVMAAVDAGFAKARNHYMQNQPGWNDDDKEFRQTAMNYVTGGAEMQLMSSALMVDGCFEVGGALAPVRVVEEQRRIEGVRYPTQDLVLAPAQTVTDIPDAVISDPRSIVMDLAAGRLLSRRYVRERIVHTKRTLMRGEIRVYLLDGSGSMIGPRARVRDAIVLGELSTLGKRLAEFGKSARVVLFYRYFNEQLGPVTRVDTAKGALASIEDVLATVRRGGTDIQTALLASLAQIKEAQTLDPDLARAQIVLVTDGEAPVDEPSLEAARAQLGDLAVSVSVIALGQENVALQGLVAKQRARGERAFYHFIPDEALTSMVDGNADAGPAIHLPSGTMKARTPAERADILRGMVGSLVEDLAVLGKQQDVEALEALDLESRARHEVGLADDIDLSEGERAKAEALQRDRRALERRFARWFPEIADDAANATGATDASLDEDADAVVVALSTVAEVVEVVGGTELARRADAIEVLERLLPDARLSLARYEAVLRERPDKVRAALVAVHGAVGRKTSPP